MFKEIEVKKRNQSGRMANKPRIYVFPKGETAAEHFFEGRHSRPYTAYRKEVLPTVFAQLSLPEDTFRVRWSQYAGCSCPCSPGFIVEGYPQGLSREDVYVTVS